MLSDVSVNASASLTPSSTMATTYLGSCQKYLLIELPYFCFTLLVLTFPSFSLLLTYLSVKNSGSSLYWLSRGLRSTAGAWLGRELGLSPIVSFQTEYYRVSKKGGGKVTSTASMLLESPLEFQYFPLNPTWFLKTSNSESDFLWDSQNIGYHFRKVSVQGH